MRIDADKAIIEIFANLGAIMYSDPYRLNVADLDRTQRRALAETVVGAAPTVTVEEDDLPDHSTWTLRKSFDATEEDYSEEMAFILMVKDEADKGVLVPTEDYLPDTAGDDDA